MSAQALMRLKTHTSSTSLPSVTEQVPVQKPSPCNYLKDAGGLGSSGRCSPTSSHCHCRLAGEPGRATGTRELSGPVFHPFFCPAWFNHALGNSKCLSLLQPVPAGSLPWPQQKVLLQQQRAALTQASFHCQSLPWWDSKDWITTAYIFCGYVEPQKNNKNHQTRRISQHSGVGTFFSPTSAPFFCPASSCGRSAGKQQQQSW